MLATALLRRISINHCIYCGAACETDEHVVPLALGGDEILEKASCEMCRAITSKWERNAIHDHWSGARAVLDYPSRRRRWETERFPLDVTTNDGRRMVLELSRRDLLGLAPFLQYPLPAFFTPDTSYMSGSVICGTSLVAFGANLEDLKQRYGIREIHYHVTYKGNHFENMLARIAYCAAIA